jgi:hypothetical protein
MALTLWKHANARGIRVKHFIFAMGLCDDWVCWMNGSEERSSLKLGETEIGREGGGKGSLVNKFRFPRKEGR